MHVGVKFPRHARKVATGWAVIQVGAKVVFADVREEDWCIDPASIRARITPRTKAVIVVHLDGQAADVPGIMRLARRHKPSRRGCPAR